MIYRRYIVPSVWEELNRMQHEVSRMTGAFTPQPARSAVAFPAINAWTTDDEEIVTSELPGMKPEDIEISVVGDVLTVSGERTPEVPEEEVRYHRRERVSGRFSRSIQLAFPVDSEHVSASYENGLLRVKLPRAEADKPRKIAVKAD